MINLPKLFTDVFDPQPGEIVLMLIDTPHGHMADTPEWAQRRAMARRWHTALAQQGTLRSFWVLPIASYPATGAHGAQLPSEVLIDREQVALADLASQATLLIAMTQFSATAPLAELAQRFPQLRAASMPLVSPAMEETALAADHGEIARICQLLQQRLSDAEYVRVAFSNGDTLLLDRRFRQVQIDDGRLHRSKRTPRVVNLPGGETYTALYEGERPGIASQTQGVLPVIWRSELVRLEIAHNQIVDVLGRSDAAADLRNVLSLDGARRNVAELGLGCNPKARVWGNMLEDEKAGPHIALGRSEHLGGVVGPDAFEDPRHIWHYDFVYARASPLHIVSMTLIDARQQHDQLVYNGEYLLDMLEIARGA